MGEIFAIIGLMWFCYAIVFYIINPFIYMIKHDVHIYIERKRAKKLGVTSSQYEAFKHLPVNKKDG